MKLLFFTIFMVFLFTKSYSDIIIEPRIRNGNDVTNIEDFNYQVGIKMFNKDGHQFWCGGSILSNDWILTAAHCLLNMDHVTLYLGTINRWQPEVGSLLLNVTKDDFIIHDFDPVLKQNDIGLIKLKNPIRFSKKIKPIDLIYNGYSKKDEFDNKDVIVSGWGAISSDLTNAIANLQYATVQILPEKKCQLAYNRAVVTSGQICTAGTKEIGVCKGDSGGPLVININGKIYQIGIASFMKKDSCETSVPRVYTRITEYLSWICTKTDICQMYMPED